MTIRKAVLPLIVAAALAMAGNVWADAYMTVANGDTTHQPTTGTPAVATYNWDQSPWLYFTIPSLAKTYTVSWWNYAGDNITDVSENAKGATALWHGFMNFSDWAAIRKDGDWTVRADYSYASGGPGTTGEIKFKINAVPEPVSSALFLLGGGAIAVLKLRKRKKSA